MTDKYEVRFIFAACAAGTVETAWPRLHLRPAETAANEADTAAVQWLSVRIRQLMESDTGFLCRPLR